MWINESPFDRSLRIVIGIAMLSLVVVGPQSMWGLLGLVPLLTGVIGVCPLYRLVGIRTCSTGDGRKSST